MTNRLWAAFMALTGRNPEIIFVTDENMKTRPAEVWRVEVSIADNFNARNNGNWHPETFTYLTKELAEAAIFRMKYDTGYIAHYVCINLTGPHQQVMPA